MANRIEIIVFGGGCFWCTEALFQNLKGVISITPGYAGGAIKNPTYEDVLTGKTGHAEVIKINYDSAQISFKDLLTVFFAIHDPTTLNKQGADIGTQYRSIILYTIEKQKEEIGDMIKKLDEPNSKIITEVKPLSDFYEAEQEYKNYYLNNPKVPYCQFVINPKLKKLKKRFNELLKTSDKK